MALDGIKGYMVGVILGIAVIVSGIFMIGSYASSDPSLDSKSDIQQFNRTLALSQNITNSVNTMESSLATTEKSGVLGWINSLFVSAFNGLKTVKTSTAFVGVAAEESADVFGVTEVKPILAIVLLVITIIILIAIYEAITRQ